MSVDLEQDGISELIAWGTNTRWADGDIVGSRWSHTPKASGVRSAALPSSSTPACSPTASIRYRGYRTGGTPAKALCAFSRKSDRSGAARAGRQRRSLSVDEALELLRHLLLARRQVLEHSEGLLGEIHAHYGFGWADRTLLLDPITQLRGAVVSHRRIKAQRLFDESKRFAHPFDRQLDLLRYLQH
jgi:hypothetical protein